MKSSRVKVQLLSIKIKIADKHKLCSLHLTAIFYIPCYATLFQFNVQLIIYKTKSINYMFFL